MDDYDNYTHDGTVDMKKNPANKKTTGNWKACRFILGIYFLPFPSFPKDMLFLSDMVIAAICYVCRK